MTDEKKILRKEWRRRNKERLRLYHQEYYKKNQAKLRQQRKLYFVLYYEQHKDEIKEAQKTRNLKRSKEKRQEEGRKYYEKNKEDVKARNIRQRFAEGTALKGKEIPNEIVELYRLKYLIKKELKKYK